MAGNKPPSKIDEGFPKEALVVVPLIGSVLAITYDVGYFYGVDIYFFTFFSVTEHLVFAMEAVPIAFILAVFITFLVGTDRGRKYLDIEAEKATKRPRQPWFTYLTAAGCVGLALMYGHASIIGALVAGIVTGYLYTVSPPRNVVLTSTGAAVLFVAWTYGFDMGHSYLKQGDASHSIQTGNQALAVNIIRSGDKGVLYYEPKEKQIAFLKWDQIQKISETRQ
jgi:hypothetical protein